MRDIVRGAMALLALAMAGCTGTGSVDPGESGPAPDHTYYVIGAEPDTVRVSLFKGSVEGGIFRQDMLTIVSFIGTSEDGFVFGETHAGTTLAVNQIEVLRNKDALAGQFYNPCGGARALVFTAPAGKVVYLGNIHFSHANGGMQVTQGYDFPAAQEFLRKHYPRFADKLERGDYRFLPVGRACQ